jgi:hypothetical protein
MTPSRPSTGSIALWVSLVAAFLYANFLIDWALRGFDGMGEIVSDLAAPGQPNATLLRITDVVCALLVVSLLPLVRAALPPSTWREILVWGTVLFATGAAVAAFVPTPCGPGMSCDDGLQTAVHDAGSIVSDTALYAGAAAAWFATRRGGPAWFHRSAWWVFWLGGVVASLLFEYFNVTRDPSWAVGASQRLHILTISAWIVCLGLLAAGAGDGRGARRSTAP